MKIIAPSILSADGSRLGEEIAAVEAAGRAFVGEIFQVPPMYSAKRRGGVRLYELARGIDGLVKHIRAEQADLRVHIEEQGETNRKLRELIEAMLREGDTEQRSN